MNTPPHLAAPDAVSLAIFLQLCYFSDRPIALSRADFVSHLSNNNNGAPPPTLECPDQLDCIDSLLFEHISSQKVLFYTTVKPAYLQRIDG